MIPWSLDDPTGYVYVTTRKKVNEIYCITEFPLTSDQQDEISAFANLVQGLRERVEAGETGAQEELEETLRDAEVGQAGQTEDQDKIALVTEEEPDDRLTDIDLTELGALTEPEEKKEDGIFSRALVFDAINKPLPFLAGLLAILIVALGIKYRFRRV